MALAARGADKPAGPAGSLAVAVDIPVAFAGSLEVALAVQDNRAVPVDIPGPADIPEPAACPDIARQAACRAASDNPVAQADSLVEAA